MKTENTPVEGVVQIWAEPKSQWKMDRDEEETGLQQFPFEYTLRTSAPYGTSNVMVHEVPMTLHVPAGINLLAKAVETLNAAIVEERKTSALRVADLQEKANRLLMLEFKDVTPPEESMESVVGLDPNQDNHAEDNSLVIDEDGNPVFATIDGAGHTIRPVTPEEFGEGDEQAERDYQDANPE